MGGDILGYQGRLDLLDLGGFEFKSLISNFQDLDTSSIRQMSAARNGIIGNLLLSRFDVILDFSNSKMYLKANRNFKKEIKVDKSGLYLLATGPNLDSYVVQYVLPNSPAHRAGIREGDIVTKINGWKSSFYSLSSVTRLLQKRVGKRIRLTISRGSEKLKKVFYLQDLI